MDCLLTLYYRLMAHDSKSLGPISFSVLVEVCQYTRDMHALAPLVIMGVFTLLTQTLLMQPLEADTLAVDTIHPHFPLRQAAILYQQVPFIFSSAIIGTNS